MTHLFFPTSSRLRASYSSKASCFFRGTCAAEPSTISWIAKVISTLCVLCRSESSSKDFTWLEYFSKTLDPITIHEVIKRLNNPTLALKFLEFNKLTSENLGHHCLAKSYHFLLKSLCDLDHHEDASKLVFHEYFPNISQLGFLISSCANAGKFDLAKDLVVKAHENKIQVDKRTCNQLLKLMVRNHVGEAVCFFKEQHLRSGVFPDKYSFHILIKGLCIAGDVDGAFEIYRMMGSYGCSPDIFTYNILIHGLCGAKKVDRARELLGQIQSRNEISPNVVTFTSILSGYCKLGDMEGALLLFDEMLHFGIRPSIITNNVLIDGFAKSGQMGLAVSMYEKMLLQGYCPDVYTLTSLIDGYCRLGRVDEAMKSWHEIAKRNIPPTGHPIAILVNALCKGNRLFEARELLRQLKSTNLDAKPFYYNPVIDGFCKAGNVDEANEIVKEMKEKRCNPDNFTYTSLIIGHCVKGRMLEAIRIFHNMLSTGCAPDSITLNSLISSLLKAGMPKEANQILLILSAQNSNLRHPLQERSVK